MLSIIYTETEQDCGYHYIIQQNCQSFSAYKTKKWFDDFIERHNIELTISDQYKDKYNKQVIIYKSDRTINNSYFTAISQVPTDAIKYTDLCNGSLVDCYYTHDAIYRPNPNCKNIYIPLEIKEHIAFRNINW